MNFTLKKAGLLVLTVAVILAFCGLTNLIRRNEGNYPGVTRENFAGIVVSSEDNYGVYTDIHAQITDTAAIIYLPCRAKPEDLVFYAVNSNGQYLERYHADLTKEAITILDTPVIFMQSEIPSLEVVTDDALGNTMAEIDADDDKLAAAYGKLYLSATDEAGVKYGYKPLYESRNFEEEYPASAMIKGRGNASWLEEKKPYLIRLEENVGLLQLPKGKKWVLAADVVDHSLLRNDVFLNLAKECHTKFTPQMAHVNLFINGEYRGVYSLCSKPEIRKTRIAIDEERDYLYRLGLESGTTRWFDSYSLNREDNVVELVNSLGDERDEKAFEVFQKFFTALEDTDSDRVMDLMDADSFARYYWVQEYSKNLDACKRSVYFWWNHYDEKMYLVAPWDFDRTAGTVEPFEQEIDFTLPTGWAVRENEWYVPLFMHEAFAEKVRDVYYNGGVREAINKASPYALKQIDYIGQSADMNFTRWDYLTRQHDNYYNKIEYFMGDTSYASETEWLWRWLEQRAQWIEEEMNSK